MLCGCISRPVKLLPFASFLFGFCVIISTNVLIVNGFLFFMGNYLHIGQRLKEERERIKLNQDDMASIGGVGRKSQFNYESGERCADASYLSAIAKVGADVQYIVTGLRTNHEEGDNTEKQLHNPKEIAKKSLEPAGFSVVESPKSVVLNWSRFSFPSFLVSHKEFNLRVFLEIYPKKRLGLKISPDNTPDFVFISESETQNAGEIVLKHFEKYGKRLVSSDENPTTFTRDEVELILLFRKMNDEQKK